MWETPNITDNFILREFITDSPFSLTWGEKKCSRSQTRKKRRNKNYKWLSMAWLTSDAEFSLFPINNDVDWCCFSSVTFHGSIVHTVTIPAHMHLARLQDGICTS
jgi:hypothetical protein